MGLLWPKRGAGSLSYRMFPLDWPVYHVNVLTREGDDVALIELVVC